VTRITEHEQDQVDAANSSGRTPVVFVHGLWLLPNSWDRWRTVFEDAGYSTVAPGWPDDPETVDDANAHPEVFAHKSIGQIADHYEDTVRKLSTKPAIVGHSFGGLLTEILAGRALAAASVAISPAPFRGVLPLPISALRSSAPVLHNPLNRGRAVPLTFEQFRYAFANTLDESEAQELYATSSKLPTPTSIRGPMPRSTRRTPTADRCSSSPPTTTTPFPGPSRTRRSRSRSATRA
jgi:non-heme chloroperoxidase